MSPEPREPSALDKLIEQEDRQLLESRMLPNEGPLTAAQRDEVVDAIKAYIDKHAISQGDVKPIFNSCWTGEPAWLLRNADFRAESAPEVENVVL